MANHKTSPIRARFPGLFLAAFTLAACGGGASGEASSEGAIPVDSTPSGAASSLVLQWEPNPAPVSGYRVYAGPTADTVSDQIYDLAADGRSLDPQNPSVGIAATDIGLTGAAGQDNVCFAVQAYNDFGESQLSAPVCATI